MAGFVRGTRVEMICPCGTDDLFLATSLIVVSLLEQEELKKWGGLTFSSLRPSVFEGRFWEEDGKQWVPDESVWITLDAPDQTARTVLPFVNRLREQVGAAYEQVGQPQRSLWMTAQELFILWP